jgi:hypothetical protein
MLYWVFDGPWRPAAHNPHRQEDEAAAKQLEHGHSLAKNHQRIHCRF